MPDSSSSVPSSAPSLEAEAARYALLRRLAPSMRHHLVVNLQPIGMIYEVMDRRLRAAVPDLAHVQESAGKINGFAKAALNSCIDVVGWLAPDDAVGVAVHDAVRECTALLATSLSFRGYALRNNVTAIDGSVRRSGVRSVLSAVLIHCTDHTPAPAELVLTASRDAEGACLRISTRPTEGDKGFTGEPNYRKITWEDLQALASADGVQLRRDGDAVELRMRWMAA
ncbi:MAG: hypothetical protein EOO30_12400 [Comamonadaceae bacterium]|nr:MAG: hypothetical protein EOO30_12400 [Comamonadaceae bacterium]